MTTFLIATSAAGVAFLTMAIVLIARKVDQLHRRVLKIEQWLPLE
jgi:hypothetical protein